MPRHRGTNEVERETEQHRSVWINGQYSVRQSSSRAVHAREGAVIAARSVCATLISIRKVVGTLLENGARARERYLVSTLSDAIPTGESKRGGILIKP